MKEWKVKLKFDIHYTDQLNREAIVEKLMIQGKNYAELLKNWIAKPGFQNLNIDESMAADIAEAAIRSGQFTIVVPAEYRTPLVSVEKAKEIAINEYRCVLD